VAAMDTRWRLKTLPTGTFRAALRLLAEHPRRGLAGLEGTTRGTDAPGRALGVPPVGAPSGMEGRARLRNLPRLCRHARRQRARDQAEAKPSAYTRASAYSRAKSAGL
jgi:hypothetical protein